MEIGECPTKNKICTTKRKTHWIFCPTGKTRGKIRCPTTLCFCPTTNWRWLAKLLILSNKHLSSKSFLVNKLKYLVYSFLKKQLYRRTLQKYNSKSSVFMSSSANKKKHWIWDNLVFMWEVSDSIKRSWDEIIHFRSFGTLVRISSTCKDDSFSHQMFVSSQWCKIFEALRTKGWRDVLFMIRLLFIVPVSNVKLLGNFR